MPLEMITMMPLPNHLVECVMPDDAFIDESALHGSLKCPCGGIAFALFYVGELTGEGEQVRIAYTERGPACFYALRARCDACGRQHTLHDRDYHGWNGFVAFDKAARKRPRPADVAFACPRCGGTAHHARIQINSQGKADFVAEAMDDGADDSQFSEDDWPNAFGWISFDVTCASCGLETKGWASDETM